VSHSVEEDLGRLGRPAAGGLNLVGQVLAAGESLGGGAEGLELADEAEVGPVGRLPKGEVLEEVGRPRRRSAGGLGDASRGNGDRQSDDGARG